MTDLPGLVAAATHLLESVTDTLFLWLVVPVLLGGGLFLTLRLNFVQVRRFVEAAKTMVAQQAQGATGILSPFQAFMTALAASIGTGNIAGVATAIISGGPGALFWIWVYGFVATSIKFSEAVLGVKFRGTANGSTQSGPMY
jgi:AGCS family alanine or glycine:cation symporter